MPVESVLGRHWTWQLSKSEARLGGITWKEIEEKKLRHLSAILHQILAHAERKHHSKGELLHKEELEEAKWRT